MLKKYSRLAIVLSILLSSVKSFSASTNQSPTYPAKNFNVFLENGVTLSTNETEGAMACGGDLTIAGNYQVSIKSTGDFKVNNVTVSLVIGGKVIYQSGYSVQVNTNGYIKIGNPEGSYVWYYDQNKAASPIRITPNSNYYSSPLIMLQANCTQLGVSTSNNPVFQANLIDFASAFQQLRNNSLSLSKATNNAQLTNPNGASIPNTGLPSQVKINLQDGVNYLNISGTELNNVSIFTYNQQPSASKILVVNVDAPGTYNWTVWNQSGIGQSQCPYIIYNFYNTTQLNIIGWNTIEGTLFAPFADIVKTVNQSNIEGQVIGKSLVHSGGEMHLANFIPGLVSSASASVGNIPTAKFDVSKTQQCLSANNFTFTNKSRADSVQDLTVPLTYAWDFGDGTSSTNLNPTKTYTNSGIYTVKLITTNTYGCDTAYNQVTVFGKTTPEVTQSVKSSGSGSIVEHFSLKNPTNYTASTWVLSDSNKTTVSDTSANFTFTKAGYYEISLTILDKNGCDNSIIIPVTIESSSVNTGNEGGLESESLGGVLSKQFLHRKQNNISTRFDKTKAKSFVKSIIAKNSTISTLQAMFPEKLMDGDVSTITSPTDILNFTIAQEVLSVDYSLNNETKAVVLGIRTSNKVYNHTKATCDRLKGAEILSVDTLKISGYNFLTQAIKQRNGVTEYAISFAIGKNSSDNFYTLQSNWLVRQYTASEDVYNFQVWGTKPEYTATLVGKIISNINSSTTIKQTESPKLPSTYAKKAARNGINLVLDLKSAQKNQSIEIIMDEKKSETSSTVLRYNPFMSDLEQSLKLEIKDGYEYDGQILVNGEIQDAFYHADGNWGLDYDSNKTSVKSYVVYNDSNRVYSNDESPIFRNVKLQANSTDYLTLYKALLPGNLSEDYSTYKYLSFKAKGSGLLEISLVKSSITDWANQYKATVNVVDTTQTYYIPFSSFTSTGSSESFSATDLSMLDFIFLPEKAQTNDLNLTIENIKFTKTASTDINVITNKSQSKFSTYPNPSKGEVNCLLYSDIGTEVTVTLRDLAGKTVYQTKVQLEIGRNDFVFDFKSLANASGIMFISISNSSTDFGVSKVLFY